MILKGLKLVEYRRRPPAQPISIIILYASAPIMRIVGVVEVTEVSCGKKDHIWVNTSAIGGITRREFEDYFTGSEMCGVLMLGKVIKLKQPILPTQVKKGFRIPQSYAYVDSDFLENVYAKGL